MQTITLSNVARRNAQTPNMSVALAKLAADLDPTVRSSSPLLVWTALEHREPDETDVPAIIDGLLHHRHTEDHSDRLQCEPVSFKQAVELAWEEVSHRGMLP